MDETTDVCEELTSFFEESFRTIEASRLGETILALCRQGAERGHLEPEQ